MPALVCMTAFQLLVVIGLFATFTSHLGAGDGFVFGVGCWFLLLVGVFLLWCFVSCCVSFLASAPYAPSYISYDVSSHSEWALDFLLGCSTTGVAFLIPF